MVKGLPRAIIKKYGVTKKAWAVYRGQHHKTSRVSRKHIGGKTMVKRRYGRARHYVGSHKGSLLKSMEKLSMGAAAAAPLIIGISEGGFTRRGAEASIKYATGFTPWSGNWALGDLLKGWTPLIATTASWAVYHKLRGLIRGL